MLLAYHTTSIHEVPGEVALVLGISECPNRCQGCHSPELRNAVGTLLTIQVFNRLLARYRGLATCVCFMGGDWYENQLAELLGVARARGYTTCLYTGAEEVSHNVTEVLTYLKTGPYMQDLGGLEISTTNQKFIRTADGADLTYMFQHKA